MTMTRADYRIVADTVRAQRQHHDDNDSPSMVAAVDMLAESLADAFLAASPRFRRSLFLTACGAWDDSGKDGQR